MRRTLLLLTLVGAILLACSGAVVAPQPTADPDDPTGPGRPTGAQKAAKPSKKPPTKERAITADSVSAAALSGPRVLGARIEGAPKDPQAIDDFATMVGQSPSPPVVMWYQS